MQSDSKQNNFCISCGKKVSHQENFCGNCGAPINKEVGKTTTAAVTQKNQNAQLKFILVVILFAVAFYLVKCGTDNASRPNDTEPAKQATISNGCAENYTSCKDNEDLINNNKMVSDAQFACKEATNKNVRYGDPDWTLYPFPKFSSGDDYPKTGVIRMFDDAVKISNGFGAMERSEVSCQYNLRKSKIELLVINGQPVIYGDTDMDASSAK